MLLRADDHRANVDTIYELDADIATLTEQIRQLSPHLKTEIDAGNITISKRAPTQEALAALMIEATQLVMPAPEATYVLGQVRKSFGVAELDMAAGRMAIPLESDTPSAFKKQTAHAVADLPTT